MFVHRVWASLRRRVRRQIVDAGWGPGLSRQQSKTRIIASGLVSGNWFKAGSALESPLADTSIDRYLDRGADQGFDLSPLFWTARYAAANPESASYGGGPIVHYLEGQGTGPNPLFDDSFYRTQTELEGRESALEHYVRKGWRSGLDPHPLFRTVWYLEQAKQDLGDMDPLSHFLLKGAADGLDPCPHFHTQAYLDRYPDVAAAKTNPLVHFVLGGVRDLRDPSATFVTARYLRSSPDARSSAINPLVHAIQAGWVDVPPATRTFSREAARTKLRVSAIVPNYNHRPFLGERLDSIVSQTLPPDEIIVLDDASTDSSISLIKSFAQDCPIPVRIIENAVNSGSPFSQWSRAIAEANGDLIWMAESDDRNAPEFLNAVVPAFEDPTVTLSWCQSRPIGRTGKVLAQDYRHYTDDLSLQRWREPYSCNGHEEISAALAHKNTMPNGSAVVFGKTAVSDRLAELQTFRQCGDWFIYVLCALAGRVAFTPEILNEHRRHPGTLTHSLGADISPLNEALRIRGMIAQAVNLSDHVLLSSIAAVASEYYGRTVGGSNPLPLSSHDDLLAGLAPLLEQSRRRFRLVPRRLHIFGTDLPERPFEGFSGMARPLAVALDSEFHEQGIWIEGSPCVSAWSMPTLWSANVPALDERRVSVLADLADLHGVAEISADDGEASHLASAVIRRRKMSQRT